MLHFIDYSKSGTVFQDYNITKVIVPVSVDTMSTCQLFTTLSLKFNDLKSKFQNIINSRTFKPGEYIKVRTDSGHTLYFIIMRNVEKFQPYIFDILKSIDRVISDIRKQHIEFKPLF